MQLNMGPFQLTNSVYFYATNFEKAYTTNFEKVACSAVPLTVTHTL